MDPIRGAIQQVLDAVGDGWTAAEYVVAVGLERINSDGELETLPWWTAPLRQADWKTDALLYKAEEMRAYADEDTD